MSREHDVCCVASRVERDTDSEQGGEAVALEGAVVLCVTVPLGKWSEPPSLCPGWDLGHPREQPKGPDEPDVVLHNPWAKSDVGTV